MAEHSKPTFRETGLQFLLTELDLALTFLSVAQVSGNPETVQRNHRHARDAYATVIALLGRIDLTAVEEADVLTKLAVLEDQLSRVDSPGD